MEKGRKLYFRPTRTIARLTAQKLSKGTHISPYRIGPKLTQLKSAEFYHIPTCTSRKLHAQEYLPFVANYCYSWQSLLSSPPRSEAGEHRKNWATPRCRVQRSWQPLPVVPQDVHPPVVETLPAPESGELCPRDKNQDGHVRELSYTIRRKCLFRLSCRRLGRRTTHIFKTLKVHLFNRLGCTTDCGKLLVPDMWGS